jgi:hypothetical protein
VIEAVEALVGTRVRRMIAAIKARLQVCGVPPVLGQFRRLNAPGTPWA